MVTGAQSRRPPFGRVLALLLAVTCSAAADDSSLGKVNTALRLQTIQGEEARPLFCEPGSQRAAVVVFVTTDCPIANRYAPELEKIRSSFAPRGVGLTLVHVDPELEVEKARDHARQFSLGAAVVIDRKHQIVRATGATVTPEAVVIDPAGRIRYRGRIDDQFTALGKRRAKPARQDLREALAAVLEGRPVQTPEAPAIGCLIPTTP
jgi:hypothetical protein